jgi:hypothetical protein
LHLLNCPAREAVFATILFPPHIQQATAWTTGVSVVVRCFVANSPNRKCYRQRPDHRAEEEERMATKLYVGNLAFSVTETDLREAFTQIGPCTSVAVVSDRETGQSRGFGFVELDSNADAERAIQQLNGQDLKGRTIKISIAQERERSGGGGGGRGNSGNRNSGDRAGNGGRW